MELQVNRLRGTLDLLKPAVPKNPALKVLNYIRLGDGKAIATDLESMIIANLGEAQEQMLLPYSEVADALKFIPGDETLTIGPAGRKAVSLSWPEGKAQYPTEAVLDFPTLPDLPTRAEGDINGDILIPTMLAALPYVTDDEKRPVLTGVTLVLGNPIEVAAGDGFRMSHQVLGVSFPAEQKTIVPARSVKILGHVFDKTPRPPSIPLVAAKRKVHVSLVGDNKLRVDFGTATVVINLIAGEPPTWLALIPKGEPVLESQIFAPQLEAAVKRLRNVAKDGSDIVRLVFKDSRLTLSAKSEDMEMEAVLDTISTKGQGRTAMNYKQLLEYLAGKQGVITLCQYDNTSPLSLQYQNSPRVLIMPMLVKWADEEPAPQPAEEAPQTAPAGGETTKEKPAPAKSKRRGKKRAATK